MEFVHSTTVGIISDKFKCEENGTWKFNLKHLRVRNERVKEAHFQHTKGIISRREFLRFSAAMGAGAMGFALLSPLERLQVGHARALRQGAVPKRGGIAVLGAGMSVTNTISDPAAIENIFVSNIIRQCVTI
ncbi:MAG: twin-arginine translocation signal domain-containing protein [Chloroflexi bacterium]|uniref:twin-arginine translocation signal domain-containing protein n=1 Tax=Candidatus Flexifilum breve TaxID=3140694 RepID=UPI0031355F15|nr:twin-arginine translocation signal domain-containing protein [Chloroflexota bacterium]